MVSEELMHAALIMNPASGTADEGELLRQTLEPMGGVDIYLTQKRGDATTMTMDAIANGATLIVAAGGDGTINEVVRGIMTAPTQVPLGIVPLGTGNDLARTLELPSDPLAAWKLAVSGNTRPLDVIHIRTDREEHFALNVSAGGFSGQMNEALTSDMKETWGPLAYLRGAAQVLPDLTEYRTTIQYDDEEVHQVDALNIIIANARTAAGGVLVAPYANPEDGLLDVVIVHYGSLPQLAGAAARLLVNSNYLNSDIVELRRARKVQVESDPEIWFNADGELITNEPIVFEILPQKLQVVVGEKYQAVVESDPLLAERKDSDE